MEGDPLESMACLVELDGMTGNGPEATREAKGDKVAAGNGNGRGKAGPHRGRAPYS